MPVKLGQHAEHIRVAINRPVPVRRLPVHQPPPGPMYQPIVDVGCVQFAAVKQPAHPPHLPEHRLALRVRPQLDGLAQLTQEDGDHADPLAQPGARVTLVILINVRHELRDGLDRRPQLAAVDDLLDLPPIVDRGRLQVYDRRQQRRRAPRGWRRLSRAAFAASP